MTAALARIVGPEHVLGADAAHYSHDVSRSMGLSGRPDAVVRPGDPDEVAAVVAWCYEHDVAIVPRGGGTGVAGGAGIRRSHTPVITPRVPSLPHSSPIRS